MTVLLTGGAGYIGSHIAALLQESGQPVFIYDNFCNSHPNVLERIERITSKPVAFVQGDILDAKLLAAVMKEEGVDSVIHLAGLKSVGESATNPLKYYRNNLQGTISLLQAMEQCEIRKLVFSSSATVYGNPEYLPIDEVHRTSAINPYGRTKLNIEEMLADIAKSDDKWRIVCLRYFNPVGAHPSGLLGESPSGVPSNLMPIIAQVATGRRTHVQIFGQDWPTADGTGVRDYIHVVDLARGHLKALSFMELNYGLHTFNLGTGKGTSVLEMIAAFEAASGRHIPFSYESRRVGDVSSCFASCMKATRELNWSTEYSLQEMCETTWNWQNRLIQET